MLYINDSVNVWHVSKLGNDANSGHAAQYPVNLAADAKLTIAAAVVAAANGDTIIIWPGDYDEAIDASAKQLHFVGTSRTKSRIVYTGDDRALQIGSNSSVYNLYCEASNINTLCAGLRASSKSNIWVENCDLVGAYDGLALSSCNNVTVIGCRVVGKYDACTVSNSTQVLIKDCKFYTDGSYGTTAPSRALVIFGARGIVRNCSFTVVRNDASSQPFGGVEMWSGAPAAGFFVVSGCVFHVTGGAGNTGAAFGVRSYYASSLIVVSGCVFYTAAAAASVVYDIYSQQGKIVVANSAYDVNKTTGVVEQADSGATSWLRSNVRIGAKL